MNKAKKVKKPRKFSLLLAVPLVAVVAGCSVVFVNQQVDINKLTQQKSAVSEKLDAQQKENDALNDIIDSGDKDAYIERVAREKYGYVKPGEKVYYDIS